MTSRARLQVGIVGLGFMGRTHIAAWRAADAAGCPNEIAAVCDRAEVITAGGRSAPGNLESAAPTEPLFDRSLVRTFEGNPSSMRMLARDPVHASQDLEQSHAAHNEPLVRLVVGSAPLRAQRNIACAIGLG
jgi:hypothetical protein